MPTCISFRNLESSGARTLWLVEATKNWYLYISKKGKRTGGQTDLSHEQHSADTLKKMFYCYLLLSPEIRDKPEQESELSIYPVENFLMAESSMFRSSSMPPYSHTIPQWSQPGKPGVVGQKQSV